MRIVRPRRVLRFGGRLREPAATSALLVGGLVAAAAVALPAAAGPTGLTAAPAAATAATAATATAASTSSATTTKNTTKNTSRPPSSSRSRYYCTRTPSGVASTTATTITFHLPDTSRCSSVGPSTATIDVYPTEQDAANGTNKVASTLTYWGQDGTATGLTPDTEYWWVGSDSLLWVRGPVRTASATATTTRTSPCTTGPVMQREVGTTWISFAQPSSSGCPNNGTFTVDVYASKADAQARTNPVGSASATGFGPAVVSGLTANAKYFFVTSDRSSVQGPVRTLKKEIVTATCTATYAIVKAFSGGYIAEVTVTAGPTSAIGDWAVAWILPTGEGFDRAWGATARMSDLGSSTPSSSQSVRRMVDARNSTPDVKLAAGETTRFAVLGTSSGTPLVPRITCSASK